MKGYTDLCRVSLFFSLLPSCTSRCKERSKKKLLVFGKLGIGEEAHGLRYTYMEPRLKLMDLQNQLCKLIFLHARTIHMRSALFSCTFHLVVVVVVVAVLCPSCLLLIFNLLNEYVFLADDHPYSSFYGFLSPKCLFVC